MENKQRKKLNNCIILFTTIFLSCFNTLAQNFPSSPSYWLFPEGNPEATRYQAIKSQPQELNKFIIKWRTNAIAGDVIPLVGNVINDPKIDETFPFAPNEIVAVVGGKIVVVDAKGFPHKLNTSNISFIKYVSMLFDTLSPTFSPYPTSTLSFGIETIEFENPKDTLAYTFIAGYDSKSDTVALIKRIVIDLRKYKPNIFASLRPFFAKRIGTDFLLFSTANIFYPSTSNSNPSVAPFFRGFSLFPSSNQVYTYPMPDITDNQNFRITVGPEISFTQPSLTSFGSSQLVLFPTMPTPSLDVNIPSPISLNSTNASKNYLLCYSILSNQIRYTFPPLELTTILDPNGKRPQTRPVFVTLNNSTTNDSLYILVAEEYRGADSSFGTSRLHLFDASGAPITFVNDPISPSFEGEQNHIWSIAVGNVDGNASNSWLPYFPNNPGKEIVVTYSSPYRTVANNKLIILRYNNGNSIPKPSPPETYLFPFDTICTFKINGWVAGVNDIDGDPKGKDEIVLVDGDNIKILRLRDYETFEFRTGKPFDTLFVKEFPNETILKAEIVDLDGDSFNDLIITTNNYTYFVGKPLPKLLEVANPKFTDYTPIEFCAGDSLQITISSKIKSEIRINLRFVPITGNQTDYANSFIIKNNIPIDREIKIISLFVDKKYLGKTGIVYIENSSDSTSVFDSTAILSFNYPSVIWDSISNSNVFVFDDIRLNFGTLCSDSVELQYSLDKKNWFTIGKSLAPNSIQSFLFQLPCLPVFDCQNYPQEGKLSLRLILTRKSIIDSSSIYTVRLKPKSFTITFDTSTTICCTKYFSWTTPLSCDSIIIFISTDSGNTFTSLSNVEALQGKFSWEQQFNLPDTILFRFCCNNGCYSTDTILYIQKPQVINTVAPNPFNPSIESTEISYKLNKDGDVSIKILDQNNRLVYELIKNIPRKANTAYCERWDGKMWDGSIVSAGLYYISLEVSDGYKEIFPIFVK